MTTATLAAVTLSGPAAMVANIPAMIGFTPTDSVVAVWLNDGSVLVTQRADLDDVLKQPTGLTGPMVKHQPDEVILLFWGLNERSDAVAAVIDEAADLSHVRDALWVKDGRWGSLMCDDPFCCPTEGHEIDPCLKAQELPEPPASSRDDLLAECKPVGTERMKPLDPHGIEGWRDKQIDRAVEAWTVGGFESEKHLIRAGRALHDVRVRDTLLWHVTGLTVDQRRDAYDLVATVARAMHPDDAAPACTVAALCAWLSGDGARANIAVDYALASVPGYSLALLVQHALNTGMNPQSWIEAMDDLSYDDVRNGKKR